MAEGDKKDLSGSRVSGEQRFRYIGFEVFPGKPKDLFKSDAEKEKYERSIAAKRAKGEVLREQCTLLEERVSATERVVLTVASLVIIAALLLPWYSAYTEVVEEAAVDVPVERVSDSLSMTAVEADTLAVSAGDSLAQLGSTESSPLEIEPAAEEEVATVKRDETGRDIQSFQGAGAHEEIITGYGLRKKVVKEYSRLSGFGTFAALGTVGSYVFSSGFVLVISAILMLLYGVLCIVLPVVNLYSVYAIKGGTDTVALKLKKNLRLNWLLLILLAVVFILSFVGADYGFDTTGMFISIGSSYGPGVFLGSLSWGVLIALAASILVAVKGIEI